MTKLILLLTLVFAALSLIPLAPKLLRLRIRFLEGVGFETLARFHRNHFEGLVVLIRVMLAVVAAVLFVLLLSA